MTSRLVPVLLVAAALLGAPVRADTVFVTITGEVENNSIGVAPLSNPAPGDPVTLTFRLDSDDFQNGPPGIPTRGYVIDEDSFTLTLGTTTLGLTDPFPAGQTPYFVIRNDDPAVDGFFTATSLTFPTGVPIDQFAFFDWFMNDFSVTYGGGTLSSLDILDAAGTYDFTGLTVFNWAIDDGPFKPLLILFEELEIRPQWEDLGGGTSGVNGVPELEGSGPLTGGSLLTLDLTDGPPSEFILLWIATAPSPLNALGGTVHGLPFDFEVLLATDPNGAFTGSDTLPAVVPSGASLTFQFVCQDLTTLFGLTLSNGLQGTTP